MRAAAQAKGRRGSRCCWRVGVPLRLRCIGARSEVHQTLNGIAVVYAVRLRLYHCGGVGIHGVAIPSWNQTDGGGAGRSCFQSAKKKKKERT
mmetsp:Transcript_20102/g.23162  ORF Transcript_20102/g.23162 Transcript_20102/m.23162 type:complete len:92 (-) Transcript_20102:14-289(-)